MNSIKNNIQQKEINSIISDAVPSKIRATVIRADPDNNCCDIRLENFNQQIMQNVPVELKDDGSFYFPTAADVNKEAVQDSNNRDINSQVLVELSRDGVIIKGPAATSEYYRYRGIQALLQDMHSDSLGAAPTGYCNGDYST